MQFFWKYIDDLMGKGLDVIVIVELLFYISASLIPLALPLAILLSSIMTFGNLAENNELTALKASGLSLYRILRPLTGIVLIIAVFTFYFANYVIPVSNLKWHSLIFDIQNTKISTVLTPGVYSKELDGYAIKVDKGEGNYFEGILIHDRTTPNQIKTIRAKKGHIYKTENGMDLFFELQDGYITEELSPEAPVFNKEGDIIRSNTYPSRRSTFKQATYKIDLSGFNLNRSQEEMFKDKYEMLNVFQINYAIDSIVNNGRDVLQNFILNIKNSHPYFSSHEYLKNAKAHKKNDTMVTAIDTSLVFDKLTTAQKIEAIKSVQTTLRSKNRNIQGQLDFMTSMEKDMDRYLIEMNRKFALTISIIVLFFIGAPLGAIVRKGGFGAPVVIAALLFMIYFVLITTGEALAVNGTVSPFVGMWFATIILMPIATLLMRSAANDRPIFSTEGLSKYLTKKKK